MRDSVAASPSPEDDNRILRGRLGESYRALERAERIAVVAALVVVASMFLPWFGVPFTSALVITGWGAFGFLQAAVLLTLAATVGIVLGRGAGIDLRPPVRTGTLISGAALWCALLLSIRFFDRPPVRLGTLEVESDVRYGIWIALAATAVMFVAGLRARRR